MDSDWYVIMKELAIDLINAMLDYWVITLIVGTLIFKTPFLVIFGIIKMVTSSKERRNR